MRVMSYGGGVNSVALLIEAVNRYEKPDLVLFADTGSEMPHTYKFLDQFVPWLHDRGILFEVCRWTRVKGEHAGEFLNLYDRSWERSELPSKAYGFSGCTSKWKQQPLDARVKRLPQYGKERIERWIGYDAGEPTRVIRMRAKRQDDPHFVWRAPLFEWGIAREDCDLIIRDAGFDNPGKSSCFICPSMKKKEILAMGRQYPDLLVKALALEDRAKATLTTAKGLGGRWSWRDFIAGLPVEESPAPASCGCHDDSADRDDD